MKMPNADDESAVGPTDLAVVIVNHDAGNEVVRCVRSVYESAGEISLQVLVVDNQSRDGSPDAVEAAFPQVRVMRNDANRGFPAAANQGMQASRSDFVFLINPDAEVTAGTLEGFLKVARDHPRAGAIGALTRTPDGTIYPSARLVPSLLLGLGHTMLAPFWPDNPWSRRYRLADWDRSRERAIDWVSGSSVLLRRAALDEVGVFDERYFMYVEDMDLCTRLRKAGWEVWFSPQLEVMHIGATATAGQRRMTLEHSKSIYTYFVKHQSPGWRAALRPFAWALLRLRAAYVSWRNHER
jgi:N-acetylglucosaminyl-diphospho-decaprenol L-rhamnosyltransferase